MIFRQEEGQFHGRRLVLLALAKDATRPSERKYNMYRHFRNLGVAALVLLASVVAHASSQPKFDAIYVFGDSYCDVGNIFLASGGTIPPAPYFQGRFSNGPLWVEHLAGTYGLPMTPSLTGGADFAFGDAQVLAAVPVSPTQSIPSVPQQVALYLSQHKGKADPNALYIVEGGGNDILNATGGSPSHLGGEIAFSLLVSIRQLQRAGARNLLVPRLFDVGLLPAARVEGISTFASAATTSLNRGLDIGLAFESFADDTHVYRIDTFALLQAVSADGSHYGFADITNPCLNTSVSPPTVCSNPSSNYFWDLVHPTVFGHAFFAVLAEQALNR
jgi:phospholipase/lecithinase/hemolysin